VQLFLILAFTPVLVLAEIELIFFPVAAVFGFMGFSMRRMLITVTLLVVAEKSDYFSVSHIHLINRCAGAGREHSQEASSHWPMEIFHTIDVMI